MEYEINEGEYEIIKLIRQLKPFGEIRINKNQNGGKLVIIKTDQTKREFDITI